MGHWYASIAVEGVTQERLVEFCCGRDLQAYVSAPQARWTFVYERASNDMDWEHLDSLGAVLSEAFACRTLCAMNADDDVLGLILHDRGKLLTRYDSSAVHRSGAWSLARGMRRPQVFPALWIALHGPSVFAVFRHISVCRLLGVPSWPARLGYEYVQIAEDCPAGFCDGLIHCPD